MLSRNEAFRANSIRPAAMNNVLKKILRIIRTDLPILILKIIRKLSLYIFLGLTYHRRHRETRICQTYTENRFVKFGYSMKIQ